MNNNWKTRPTFIDEIDLNSSTTHIAFFDESGSANMKNIFDSARNNKPIDEGSKHFSLTCALFEKESVVKLKENFVDIKNLYWPQEGCYAYKDGKYKKVCFHATEIKRKTGPFSKKCIDYKKFIDSLNTLLSSQKMLIFSSFIDKEKMYDVYKMNAQSPYEVSLTFILERMLSRLLKDNDEVILILEGRGQKEDKLIFDYILFLINHGTYYVPSSKFSKIKGVYFNTKRPVTNNKLSYYGLEVADLCSYHIYKHCRNRNIENKTFECIEPKFFGYRNYIGKGLKIFPQ